jgi:transcriptional regulator with XRE-family HTH domain
MTERDKIDRIMQLENLNAAQFAAEIGIQSSTLSHIINGRNKPSLDVLSRILKRFKNISSDWLILDVGPIYRQESNSQTPTLFDNLDETNTNSNTYTPPESFEKASTISSNQKNEPNLSAKIQNNETLAALPPQPEAIIRMPDNRKVKKIIVYYSDNTFDEFDACNKIKNG